MGEHAVLSGFVRGGWKVEDAVVKYGKRCCVGTCFEA